MPDSQLLISLSAHFLQSCERWTSWNRSFDSTFVELKALCNCPRGQRFVAATVLPGLCWGIAPQHQWTLELLLKSIVGCCWFVFDRRVVINIEISRASLCWNIGSQVTANASKELLHELPAERFQALQCPELISLGWPCATWVSSSLLYVVRATEIDKDSNQHCRVTWSSRSVICFHLARADFQVILSWFNGNSELTFWCFLHVPPWCILTCLGHKIQQSSWVNQQITLKGQCWTHRGQWLPLCGWSQLLPCWWTAHRAWSVSLVWRLDLKL